LCIGKPWLAWEGVVLFLGDGGEGPVHILLHIVMVGWV